MPEPFSPLRYPGGKASLTPLLVAILNANGIRDGVYVEPYAGGAGAALGLLLGEHVSRIVINDADLHIYAFWWAILNRTAKFLDLLKKTPLTIREWRKQREIYLHPNRHSRTTSGFATFYLNRCNRSGILANGGPIGGYDQAGTWKLDARYDRKKLAARIERIALFGERIEVFNLDAVDLLRTTFRRKTAAERTFVYLDPPYYKKGSKLYLNVYAHKDHVRLSDVLRRQTQYRWLVSYDDVADIRSIWSDFNQLKFNLSYTAYNRRSGGELLIYNDDLVMPETARGLLPAC